MGFIDQYGVRGEVIIYGAQIYATSVYGALKECCPEIEIKAFLVTKEEGNPKEIDGIPVWEAFAVPFEMRDCNVLIATPEFYHKEIIVYLEQLSFKNVMPISGEMQEILLKDYFRKLYAVKGMNFLTVDDMVGPVSKDVSGRSKPTIQFQAYMARTVYDRELSYDADVPSWISPVHAGAALTDTRVCDMRDDEGDNISGRNRDYCELTAIYWAWKNDRISDYIGLCHYRRYLAIGDEEIQLLSENHIDAILPYPMLVYPNAFAHHKRFVKDTDWNRMMEILKEDYPDYYEASELIWKKRGFYLHNVFVLNRNTAEDFLQWLFSILFKVEKMECEAGEKRQDRHMGYLGENLTTLYFMFNQERLRICHAREIILH